jgi:very-short-patch-repair endonuclease
MPTNNEKYVKENTRTSHKRYESMVMYALHYALQDVLLESQYPVLRDDGSQPYRLDGYFPNLNVAIEIDEAHHINNFEEDRKRENYIIEKLGCKFFRVNAYDDKESVYRQLENIINIIKEIVFEKKVERWEYVRPLRNDGDYSNKKIKALEEAGSYEFTEKIHNLCKGLGLNLRECDIPGHIEEGNGYLGFLIDFPGCLELSLSVTASNKPKINITRIDDDSFIKTLDWDLVENNPDKNRTYWNIEKINGLPTLISRVKGQGKDKEDVLEFLHNLSQKIKARKSNK